MEIINSKEYRITRFVLTCSSSTEEDLRELNLLFRSEAYKKYQTQQTEVIRASSRGILKIFESRKSVLEKRIRTAMDQEGNSQKPVIGPMPFCPHTEVGAGRWIG